jgi:hypothetical protein
VTEVETSFIVPSTPQHAWKALEELRVGRTDLDQEPQEWWLPGFESRAIEIESDETQRLTVRKSDPPCDGTLIAITFEHVDTGTRIRVVQSGFDEEFVRAGGESFWIHAEHIFADLQLFLQTGVIGRRAWRPIVWLGVRAVTTPYGVEVMDVTPDTWADRIGLRAGDILLTVSGAPLFDTRDLGTVQRILHADDVARGTWARNGERFDATASVG